MTSPSSLENKKLSFGKFYFIGAMPEENQVDFELANRAVQEELNRLAGEIHDGLAQHLSAICLQLIVAKELISSTRGNPLGNIQQAIELAKVGLAETSRCVHNLRRSVVDESGLREALQGLAERDRKKAEEALRASEERWRKLFETSSAGIALVAPDGRYIVANLALQKILGYTEEELQRLTTLKVTYEEDRPGTEVILAECADGLPRNYRITKRYRRKDGNVIWADVSSTLVPATGDTPAFFATVVVDINERKRAEEELHQKQISLREAQSELAHVSRVTTMGELAASIAHEVSQPLAGIVTNANASLRWLGGESPNLAEARESIRRIIRDGNRSTNVVSRMGTLFKKAYTAMESLDINDAIEEVVTLTEREAQRNNVTLHTELAADIPPLTGDRVQLQQVIVNLILNGIEAMRSVEDRERNLIMRTQCGEGGEVRVAVQDSGIGFDPKSAERMFDAFHTTKPGGLGMGLSISRSIVESHGGRLWAVANDRPGATFQFTLFERSKNRPDSS
jgi:PAS domain S-box-containing protein